LQQNKRQHQILLTSSKIENILQKVYLHGDPNFYIAFLGKSKKKFLLPVIRFHIVA